ncbi:DUF1127 domain-containing protein [Billgrantia sp. LNSP4103-1]|uniref:DUF1127 domain-containing protein n=1 Tax=Billgrantia sp. LNSP4103-1 TaxID=3410266 RepID=UPI00403F7B87
MRTVTCNASCCAATRRDRASHLDLSLLGAGLARVRHWMQLRHERKQLSELSDRMLRDIGLTRHEAAREARRRVWDDIGWWR